MILNPQCISQGYRILEWHIFHFSYTTFNFANHHDVYSGCLGQLTLAIR